MSTKKEFIRFSIAGAIIGATDLGMYYLLINILPINFSKGIAFICAGIVAYLLNKFWIFRYNHLPSSTEVFRFFLTNILMLAINIVMNRFVLNLWPGHILLAFIIASMTTGSLSFVCFKWWVFRAPLSLVKL